MTAHLALPARGPLRGRLRPPGDKSVSHRALLLGAIAEGTTTIRGVLDSADVRSTAGCLAALGLPARGDWAGTLTIEGGFPRVPAGPLDCGNSGTTMRLLAGLIAGSWQLQAELVGDASLSRRPMERVAEPLRAMGARVETAPGGVAPLRVRGGTLAGITHASRVASAQVKSAVLLAALNARGTTRLREPARSRDHTERLLRAMGARLDEQDGWLSLEGGQRLRGRELRVPADPSSAAFLLVASLLVPGSEVACEGVGLNPTRTGALDALRALGAEVEVTEDAGDAVEPTGAVTARAPRGLRGAALGGELVLRAIDEVPILGVLAAFAAGRTVIRDAGELRVKESDRLAVLAAGLRALGVQVDELPDGVVIEGDPERTLRAPAAPLATEGDHRLAMAFGVAALRADGPVALDDGACVAVSYRSFWDDLAGLQ